MTYSRFVVPVIICFALCVEIAPAQDERPDMPMRGPGVERLERLKKMRLLEVLNLQEEVSVRFFSRYNSYQEELKEFQQRRQRALAALEETKTSNASDAELEKAIQSLRAMDSTFLELRDKHWKEVREILNTKQFAAYVVFEHNFQRYLREMMREIQRDRPGRMMQRGR